MDTPSLTVWGQVVGTTYTSTLKMIVTTTVKGYGYWVQVAAEARVARASPETQVGATHSLSE